jgi:thiosulfate reductase cytochrome b subunit
MTYSGYMRSAMAQPTASEEERSALLTGRHGVSEQTRACLSCHGDPQLQPKTERGKSLNLLVEKPVYGVGAHGALPCAACHYGLTGEDSFKEQPHAVAPSRTVDCKSCHIERLAGEVKAFDASAHVKKTEGRFACVNCHNAHSQPQDGRQTKYMAAVAQYNQTCLNCHANAEKFAQLTATPLNLKAMAHSFMVKFQAHREKVLCVDCHSAMGTGKADAEPHRGLEKAQSLHACSSCHRDMDSLIVSRVSWRDGNSDALSGSYIPGSKSTGTADRVGLWALAGLAAAVFLHGVMRLMGRKKANTGAGLREFVYPLLIRLFHWINALCFLLLLWTGFGIHHEGLPLVPALETATVIHKYAAYALMANFAAFLFYAATTGDIRQYLPHGSGIGGRIVSQARYYLYGMFTGSGKPFAVTREHRFNPLQQITYLVVFILGMPVLILSGMMLLLPESITAGIAQRETLATAHYCLAVAYGLFLVAHLYLATTGDRIGSLVSGMITGYHEHRKEQ